MKITKTKVQLVHNPTAGAEEHECDQLIDMLSAAGYQCNYSSSKKKLFKKIAVDVKYIVVAGGDGTVRKTVLELLERKLKHKRPLAILPLGTANNIAKSLSIDENLRQNADAWKREQLQKLDVGLAKTRKDVQRFVESFGFGLFPALIKWMDEQPRTPSEEPEDELRQALNALLHLTKHYEPVKASLLFDGRKVEDEFIMVELMNIARLGPKIQIAKDADPGDGMLELVLVKAKQRPLLIKYLEDILAGKKPVFPVKPIRVNRLQVFWQHTNIHADDELVETTQHTWDVHVLPHMLEVLLTDQR
jgi:diacylglycerol kinase family enzyme